jgi:hypothetical protein
MQNSFSHAKSFNQGDRVFVSIADGAARFLVD